MAPQSVCAIFGDQKLLSRAPPCFGRHFKPLVQAAFAVVSTHQPALGPRGGSPVLLMCNPIQHCVTTAIARRSELTAGPSEGRAPRLTCKEEI
jgi:hypothetical protein